MPYHGLTPLPRHIAGEGVHVHPPAGGENVAVPHVGAPAV